MGEEAVLAAVGDPDGGPIGPDAARREVGVVELELALRDTFATLEVVGVDGVIGAVAVLGEPERGAIGPHPGGHVVVGVELLDVTGDVPLELDVAGGRAGRSAAAATHARADGGTGDQAGGDGHGRVHRARVVSGERPDRHVVDVVAVVVRGVRMVWRRYEAKHSVGNEEVVPIGSEQIPGSGGALRVVGGVRRHRVGPVLQVRHGGRSGGRQRLVDVLDVDGHRDHRGGTEWVGGRHPQGVGPPTLVVESGPGLELAGRWSYPEERGLGAAQRIGERIAIGVHGRDRRSDGSIRGCVLGNLSEGLDGVEVWWLVRHRRGGQRQRSGHRGREAAKGPGAVLGQSRSGTEGDLRHLPRNRRHEDLIAPGVAQRDGD